MTTRSLAVLALFLGACAGDDGAIEPDAGADAGPGINLAWLGTHELRIFDADGGDFGDDGCMAITPGPSGSEIHVRLYRFGSDDTAGYETGWFVEQTFEQIGSTYTLALPPFTVGTRFVSQSRAWTTFNRGPIDGYLILDATGSVSVGGVRHDAILTLFHDDASTACAE